MRPVILLCLLLLLPLPVLAAAPQVLFDQGHRQAFVIESDGPLQLSQLADTFARHGWQVNSTGEELTEQRLAAVDAIIISGAFRTLSPAEIATVSGYVQAGGQLVVMIHIGQPLLPLLHRFGVDVANRVIHDQPLQAGGKSTDFPITNFTQHPLTSGLQQFSIYGGWPLQAFEQSGTPLATSSPHAWVDLNQDQQLTEGDLISPFDVLIAGDYGQGRFVVFADDAIFQNQFLQAGNKQLAENLARWLKGGHAGQVEI